MAEGKVINQSGVRQDELLKKIKAIPARRMLLVFNACHSGAVSPGVLGDEEETGQSVLQDVAGALLSAGEGRIIMTACREEQKSYYERGDNTPMTIFTQKLVAGLNGQDIQARKGTIGVFDTVCGTVYSKYKLTQEPELTVCKGVGVMAVALYPGQAQQGELGAEDRPGDLGRAVHELDAEQSRQLYEKVINLQIGQIGNTTNIGRDQFNLPNAVGTVINSQAPIHQYFGDTVHGNKVRGDNINVGNISSTGVAIGRDVHANVSTGAPRLYFDMPASGAPLRLTLQEALNEVRAAEAQARQVNLSGIAYDLQRVAGELDVALQAEASGDTARYRQMLDRALRDLGGLAAQDSRVQPLLSIVQQVSSSTTHRLRRQ